MRLGIPAIRMRFAMAFTVAVLLPGERMLLAARQTQNREAQ